MMLMRFLFSGLFFLTCCFVQAQKAEPVRATINGYCSGRVSVANLLSKPEVVLHTSYKGVAVQKVKLSFLGRGTVAEFQGVGPKLTAQMQEFIKEQHPGQKLHFQVFAVASDGVTMELEPIILEVAPPGTKGIRCNYLAKAVVGNSANLSITKSMLLNIGRVTVANNPKAKVERFTFRADVDGKFYKIVCNGDQFSPKAIAVLKRMQPGDKIQLIDVIATVDGHLVYLNTIRIRLK